MSASDQASIDFQYVLHEWGWATAVLAVGGTKVEMTSSDLGDPIQELLLALLNLRKGFSKVKILFVDEPGEHLLEVFPLSAETLTVELSWFDDWESHDPNAKKKRILAASVSRSEFEEVIMGTVSGLLEMWGLEGYKRRWLNDFPSKEHDALIREM